MSKLTKEEVKKMQMDVVGGIEKFSDMIGEEDTSKSETYGFLPGVGLNTEAKLLIEKAEEIRKGIFNVLFAGVFNGGKSTIINALAGRNVLPTSIRAETATISKLLFGMPEEKVTIIYSDEPKKAELMGKAAGEHEIITLEEFQEKYRLRNSDVKPEAIDHVEINLTNDVFENLSQFVDSLGTDNAKIESKISKEYEPKADAVIFLMNATEAFKESEQDKAVKYFHKQLKNVFFVVNRFNSLGTPEEQEDVINFTRNFLKPVFEDSEGNVDEELMNKRIFFVNAKGAEQLRTTGIYTELRGKKEVQIDLSIDETGIPKFEEALSEFLLSEDKYRESYISELSTLKGYFESFRKTTEKKIKLLESDIDTIIKQKNTTEAAIKEIKRNLDQLRNLFNNFIKELEVCVGTEYLNFTNSVRSEWDEYFAEKAKDIGFGVISSSKVAVINVGKKCVSATKRVVKTFNSAIRTVAEKLGREVNKANLSGYDETLDNLEQKIKNEVTAITDAIFFVEYEGIGEDKKIVKTGGYIGEKLEVFKENIGASLNKKISQEGGFIDSIEAICKELDEKFKTIDIDMNELLASLYQSLGVNIQEGTELKGSFGQALVALFLTGDPDYAINAINLGYGIGDFIQKIILRTLLEVIIALVVMALSGGLIFYVIIRAIIGVFTVAKGADRTVKKIFEGTKNEVCTALEGSQAKVVADISVNFKKNLNEKLKPMFNGLEGKLDDEVAALNKTIEDINDKTITADSERERFAKIEAVMVEAYNEIAKAIDEKTYLSADEILG